MIRLHNVGLSTTLSVPLRSKSESNGPSIPSRKLAGYWIVRVEPSKGSVEIQSEVDDTEEAPDDGMQEAPTIAGTLAVESGDRAGDPPSIESTHTAGKNGDQDADDAVTGSLHEKLVLESSFRVLVLHGTSASELKLVSEVVRSIPETLGLHATVSESLGPQSSPFFQEGNSGLRKGEMGESLALALGLTTLDAVRVTGQLLVGLLQVPTALSSNEYLELSGRAIREFLGSMLDSTLPMDGLAALVEFLDLTGFDTDLPGSELKASFDTCLKADEIYGQNLVTLSEGTMQQLVRVENQSALAARLAWSRGRKVAYDARSLRVPIIYQPSSHHFREAMYGALATVMEERDEAHAQMVAAGVLHAHEMDQQQKKVERLRSELDALQSRQSPAAGSSDSSNNVDEIRRTARALQEESEAELMSLCQQLTTEISSRTSASLEIARLKECRRLEKENELAERKALEDELKRTRELLAAERSKLERSRRESSSWKVSYEEVLVHGSETASENAEEPA
jgi:hypothetical protein